mmetsp:Transcript_13950/g.19965  ORF Transcript_13950/g.19965 Transcript_13950/m.19965 type:complete len:175 (-) Transcript_13950:318-842(-)|eukprot:CAMPEP_0184872050 /NCGR_PEP_ID=MMETSP0580-20130426/41064_1 /TAXON_ID=1118495 /ORGANISM="Dactyliosolen fragilissimus" /LENGTH=174 /DNA_ID=CAMNT_0027374787 /DNA_START=913 /DNA_END=1437 /DNA_ORIENTATION=+
MKAKFRTLPSLPELYGFLESILNEIVDHDKEGTILNFLLGCGETVQFAYSWPGARPNSNVWNGLHYLVREAPFHAATLSDCDYAVDFAQLTQEDDRVAVIATKPLTINEKWIELQRGELILFNDGVPHNNVSDCVAPEIAGHGLSSEVIPSKFGLEEDTRRFNLNENISAGFGI